MVDITFRTDDVDWGTGKGSNLTAPEIDRNFFNLKDAVETMAASPTQPLQIHDIEVVGNQMTIVLSDMTTTFGPYTLPTAAFNWTNGDNGGAWLPEHEYKAFDLFTALQGMYMVLQDHESGPTFDPDASNLAGKLYQLIFPYPTGYDFGCFFPNKIGVGIASNRPIFATIARRKFIIPSGASGSLARLGSGPASSLVLPIHKNDTEIGSINFEASGTTGTFTFTTSQTFEIGDIFKIIRQEEMDDDAEDLMVTMAGTLSI